MIDILRHIITTTNETLLKALIKINMLLLLQSHLLMRLLQRYLRRTVRLIRHAVCDASITALIDVLRLLRNIISNKLIAHQRLINILVRRILHKRSRHVNLIRLIRALPLPLIDLNVYLYLHLRPLSLFL